VIAALALLGMLQGSAPLITTRVDRTHLAVGETLILTIRARTTSTQPLSLVLPPFPGFAVVATHEVSDVAVADPTGAGALRSTVREVTLRPTRPGTLVLGPIHATQGGKKWATKPIAIVVDRASGSPPLLSPPAQALLDAAPPPKNGDQVFLTVAVPAETVLVGQQLDVLVTAWFPRDLRLRLRGQPRVALPVPARVWSYPEERPEESVAAREVRGKWMDAYVLHCIIFPLEVGRLTIPSASVEYGVPVSFSIFSREEHYSLQSDSIGITVAAAPAAGRPADDQQVVGEGLAVTLSLTPADPRVGEPVTAVAAVSGVGNAALWPAPALRWPGGFRVYPSETELTIEPLNGRVAGTKTVSLLVVPESAGTFVLPEVRYPYYDLSAGGYAVARTAPRTVVVVPGIEPQVARALPPLLAPDRAFLQADTLLDGVGPIGWAILLCAPPLVAGIALRKRRRKGTSASVQDSVAVSRLGRLEREFLSVLSSYVIDPVARDGDGLARALRGAGVDSPVADHVMRLRDRLRAARYGPRGAGDAAELAAELEQVLHVLGAEPSAPRRRRVATVLAVAALVLSRAGAAQAPRAEDLYDAGALRAAADSFAARAADQPDVPAHWYDLGATLYRAGADGKAAAAWTIAARLAPRNPVIRRARALLPPPDAASVDLLSVGPVTPGEWLLAAAVGWIFLWSAVIAWRRRGVILALLALVLLACAFGVAERARRARPLAVVVNAATAVRAAPYGSATPTATVDAGAALLVEARYGRWVEVRRADGIHGWVLGTDVVRL